jgi:glutathione S-transferase
MRLFYDPLSTTSRAVLLFALDAGLELDLVHVGLAQGEQYGEAFQALNPNRRVPVLEEDGFVLTECSAILKHLAEGTDAYPAERRARSRINERMDWFNTGFAFDAGYCLAYPVLMPHLQAANAEVQAALTLRARQGTEGWLAVLDRHWLGPSAFVCGPGISVADYLGAVYVSLLDTVGFDLAPYPNVARWMQAMRRRPGWPEAFAAFDGLLSGLARQTA